MKTIILKLITGEEIIGQHESEVDQPFDGMFNITNVASIIYNYDDKGNYGLHLDPYLWVIKGGDVCMKERHVLAYGTPKDIVNDYYIAFSKKVEKSSGEITNPQLFDNIQLH